MFFLSKSGCKFDLTLLLFAAVSACIARGCGFASLGWLRIGRRALLPIVVVVLGSCMFVRLGAGVLLGRWWPCWEDVNVVGSFRDWTFQHGKS